MKRKNAETLRTVLLRMLREDGLEMPLNEHRAVEAWPKIAGPAISRLTGDVAIRNSTLYIKITRPSLRQDLMMGRQRLVQQINDEVGAQVVENIVFY